MSGKTNRLLLALPIGTTLAPYVPLIALIVVGLLFTVLDVWTAWQLSRRVRKKGMSSGKFKSEHAKRIVVTMQGLLIVILASYAVEHYVLNMLGTLYIANWATAVFCVVHGVSILENISSEQEGWWAIALQKVLINKASRHYDIDPEILEPKNKNDHA